MLDRPRDTAAAQGPHFQLEESSSSLHGLLSSGHSILGHCRKELELCPPASPSSQPNSSPPFSACLCARNSTTSVCARRLQGFWTGYPSVLRSTLGVQQQHVATVSRLDDKSRKRRHVARFVCLLTMAIPHLPKSLAPHHVGCTAQYVHALPQLRSRLS